MRISDWSSDVCSSDLPPAHFGQVAIEAAPGKTQQVPARLAGHSFTAWLPDNVQTISGDNLETLIAGPGGGAVLAQVGDRSEEHTSELQSLMRISYAVFCLKKKKRQ